jgi:hypothetical protein
VDCPPHTLGLAELADREHLFLTDWFFFFLVTFFADVHFQPEPKVALTVDPQDLQLLVVLASEFSFPSHCFQRRQVVFAYFENIEGDISHHGFALLREPNVDRVAPQRSSWLSAGIHGWSSISNELFVRFFHLIFHFDPAPIGAIVVQKPTWVGLDLLGRVSTR